MPANFEYLRRRIHQMGAWAGVRWLRNQGFTLTQAHMVLFGVPPRYPAHLLFQAQFLNQSRPHA